MNLQNLEKTAHEIEKIAKSAGKLITSKNHVEIIEKTDAANIVTNMDLASQNYIISECQKLIPDSSFLAEEEGRQQLCEGYTWVIDPIDGTTNYAYDYKHSCISIALLYNKKALIGVVYNPYLDECFIGIQGQASTCNGQVIHAAHHDLAHSLMMIGTAPYYKELTDKTFDLAKKYFMSCRDIRRSGSGALDICYMACGRVDGYYEARLSPWDYAAGLLIAENAGVQVIALDHETFDYTKPVGVLLGTPANFKQLKAIAEETDE